jgi:hypothetical protein
MFRYMGQKDRFGKYTGSINADELHACLTSCVMIRRMKAAVLTQLPPKQRQQVFLTGEHLTGMAKIKTLLGELKEVKLKVVRPLMEPEAPVP